MEEKGKFITRLYHGDKFAANVAILPQTDHLPFGFGQELRVSSFSPASDRCYPLVVLRTIATEGVLFKLQRAEMSHPAELRELEMIHSLCLKEFKTAVISLDMGSELHLVAMTGSRDQWPCFWGFHTMLGLYNSCLTMLNLRCLALVFDLDETLIVANTMRSFEDRIEALGSKIRAETDAQKLSGMSAELKRYIQDRTLLKQFVDDDRVWDNAAEKYVDAQREVVHPITEGAVSITRPVVRLQERNMVFTRINPNVRDTSVLVRLRPAWEDLRSYLTAKGRKRFEVFICTMSEKEYALEMWRLLDPEAQLINARELTERVVCVKSGSKKSLTNVFSYGHCHPKMAMVIDDRLKVWEDRDQSHVHVVPPFAPYYAPQAETNSPVPILCVARNVACNVRGGFFRDFDEGLLKKMVEVDFNADVSTLPQPPAISNYLMAEEEIPPYELANGNKEFADGMADAEVEKGLASGEIGGGAVMKFPNMSLESEGWKSTVHPPIQQALPIQFSSPALLRPQPSYTETRHDEKQDFNRFPKDLAMLRPITAAPSQFFEPALQSSPVREEGEVPESELDPDTRRRLLILQHGQDTENPRNPQDNSMDSSFSLKGQLHLSLPSAAPAGGWLGAEEEMSPRQLSRSSSGIILEPESPSFGKQRPHGPSFFGGPDLVSIDGNSRDFRRNVTEEVYIGEERQRSDSMFLDHPYPENDGSTILNTSNSREFQVRSNSSTNNTSPVTVLQEIAQKCKTRVDFKTLLDTSTTELQFSVEVLFGGEKVGDGIGRTKKEAQHRAADNSLRFMASQFISHPTQAIDILGHGRLINMYANDEPAPRWNTRDPRFFAGLAPSSVDEDSPIAGTLGQSKYLDFRHAQEPNRAYIVAALKDHCTMEGITVVFKDPSQGAPSSELQSQGFSCQVEVAGQVMGKGSGRSWDEAKQQAAEEAFRRLTSPAQPRGSQKRMNSPRSPPLQSNKRVRSGELPRGLQRLPPSPRKLSPRRYTKNGSSAP